MVGSLPVPWSMFLWHLVLVMPSSSSLLCFVCFLLLPFCAPQLTFPSYFPASSALSADDPEAVGAPLCSKHGKKHQGCGAMPGRSKLDKEGFVLYTVGVDKVCCGKTDWQRSWWSTWQPSRTRKVLSTIDPILVRENPSPRGIVSRDQLFKHLSLQRHYTVSFKQAGTTPTYGQAHIFLQ